MEQRECDVMRMTRRRRKRSGLSSVGRTAASHRMTRARRRRWCWKQYRDVRLRQASAIVSMGAFYLTQLPLPRASADSLPPVAQAHEGLREVEAESRNAHAKHLLEKKKNANVRACQEADARLQQAEKHLADCRAELRIYEKTSFKGRIVEEHRERWQVEYEHAQLERDRAELAWTDCHVEAMEIGRSLAKLTGDAGSSVSMGITYDSWSSSSGTRDGHQLIMPVQASYQKDSFTIRANGGIFAQAKDSFTNYRNITGMMDTDLEASWQEEHVRHGVSYLLSLHLPTGKQMAADALLPRGWETDLPLHTGWNVSPGVAFSYHYTPDDVLTMKGSISWNGSYDAPYRFDDAGRVRPGRSYQQEIRYLHRGLGTNYLLHCFHGAEETSRIGPYAYRPGDVNMMGIYADRYITEHDAWQAYAISFRQVAGHYGLVSFFQLDGRCSGNLYGLGWRREMKQGREAFLRLEYMKMGGSYVDPVRNELQSNVRCWSGSFGWRQHLAKDMELESLLTCYRQEDDVNGRVNGWRTSLTIQYDL